MKVIVIIPAYNEEKNLNKLFQGIRQLCPDFDILVVNDCSRDRTHDICQSNNVKVINLPVNLGIGGAVQTGYKYACKNSYDIAVQLDGDGQHDPASIALLVKEIKNGYNLCIGSRFITGRGFQSTLFRRAGIRFFSLLIRFMTGQLITDPTSGFRACDCEVIRNFSLEYPTDYPEPETLVKVFNRGMKIKEVPVEMKQRECGKSSITNIKSLYYLVKVSIAIMIASLYRVKY